VAKAFSGLGDTVGLAADRTSMTGMSAGQLFFETDTYLTYVYDGASWRQVASNRMNASGGNTTNTYTDYTGFTYRVHTFTTVGNSTFTVSKAGLASVLLVAGGGGGGALGGGGGAGGLIYQHNVAFPIGSITISVGAGGNGGTGGAGGNPGNSGSNSSISGTGFTTLTAIGGGYGAGHSSSPTGGNGGSGGGNNYQVANTLAYGGLPLASNGAFSDTTGQGTFGGPSESQNPYHNGGGGGAGTGGGTAVRSHGGKGGDGLRIDITGTPTWYAGGGGGGHHNDFVGTAGGRGMGGGGDGGVNAGAAATANTGGGGGGGGYQSGTFYAGGAGGSGICIIRYII